MTAPDRSAKSPRSRRLNPVPAGNIFTSRDTAPQACRGGRWGRARGSPAVRGAEACEKLPAAPLSSSLKPVILQATARVFVMLGNAGDLNVHPGEGGGMNAVDVTESTANFDDSVDETLAKPSGGHISSMDNVWGSGELTESGGGCLDENLSREAVGSRFGESGIRREEEFVNVEVNADGEHLDNGRGIGGVGDIEGGGGKGFDGHGYEGIEEASERPGCRIDGVNLGSDSLDVEKVVSRVDSGFASLDPSLWEIIQTLSKVDGSNWGMKAVTNSDLFPRIEKHLHHDIFKGNNSSDLENQAGEGLLQTKISNGETAGVSSTREGIVHPQALHLVVDLNSCIKMYGNYQSEGHQGFSLSDCTAVNVNCDVNADEKSDKLIQKHETGIEALRDRKRKDREEGCFGVSDLVWGKVRGHPWWPGQIFGPWDASESAKKYFRPNSYLVAYFGDQTFAWNEEIKLKPFWPHFSLMEKQSNMEAFQHAVNCALEEASRRVGFALSCHCIAEDFYDKIKTQVVVNAGIREQSSVRQGGDRLFSALSFETVKLVHSVRELAQSPCVEVERLELVTIRAQLSAFYRWKGYHGLTEFEVSDEVLNNGVSASLLGEVGGIIEVMEDGTPTSKNGWKISSGEGTNTEHDILPQKKTHITGDSHLPGRKEKRLADLMAKQGSHLENGKETKGKAGPSRKKLKAVDSLYNVSQIKGGISGQGATDVMSRDANKSLEIGERIRKVANRVSFPSQTKHDNVLSSEKTSATEHTAKLSKRKRTVLSVEYSAPDEMLSQLRLAARDSLRGYSFLSSMVSSFSIFRNSVVHDNEASQELEESVKNVSAGNSKKIPSSSLSEFNENPEENTFGQNSKKKALKSEVSATSEFEGIEDSYWTDRIISVPEEQAFLAYEKERAVSNCEKMEMGQFSEKTDDLSPAALILNFSDSDCIPSEPELNKIFNRYGSLLEAETEVLKKSKRAKVVFKRWADAETAFSSSGKFRTILRFRNPSTATGKKKFKPYSVTPLTVVYETSAAARDLQPVFPLPGDQFPQNDRKWMDHNFWDHANKFRGLSSYGLHRELKSSLSRGTSFLHLSAASSLLLNGEQGGLLNTIPWLPKQIRHVTPPRASKDVPYSYRYPPMTKKPRWWWRTLSCLPYLMPLHETWMYAETAYHLHPFLEDFEFLTYPFLGAIGSLPSWFLMAYFFVAYLGIVRRKEWPHFFRFHVVMGMLLEIALQVIGTVSRWMPLGVYWGKIGMHFWTAVAFGYLFTVLESIRCALAGMYADIPFVCDAAYIQIPYD
ncbi:hypothetical protein Nepgr_011938 [Nepenthes gracilis]|uniref:PWWP domain-containing protein n=1 Tax=Nepenthes gracilis TaxID=150966 RepID=A0AAD3SGE8_NEPGR|nr:hypothetical protein Nepgr_011938 [Nepenthes gracilis]